MGEKKLEENRRIEEENNNSIDNKKTRKTQAKQNRLEGVIEKIEQENKKINNINSKKDFQDKEKNKQSELVSKNNEINKQELKKIEEEIKWQTKIPEEKIKKIYLKVFESLIYAIVIIIYFIMLCLGSKSIQKEVFLIDLKVFSIFTVSITIFMIEYSYKKDNTRYAIHSIELLVLSIITLLTSYYYIEYNNKFIEILISISLVFAIYYVGKAIIDYVKSKKKELRIIRNADKFEK